MQENSRKNINFCFIDYMKAFDCVWITTNCGKFLEMWILDHFICLLRSLFAGKEATVRSRHGRRDWFKIQKGIRHGCILSTCFFFNLYAEYIMWNAGLDDSQGTVKISARNIRYADDITLMAKLKEELRSLLIRVKKESEKAGLKLKLKNLRSWHLIPSFHGK